LRASLCSPTSDMNRIRSGVERIAQVTRQAEAMPVERLATDESLAFQRGKYAAGWNEITVLHGAWACITDASVLMRQRRLSRTITSDRRRTDGERRPRNSLASCNQCGVTFRKFNQRVPSSQLLALRRSRREVQRTPPAAKTCLSSSVQLTTTRSLPPLAPRRCMMKWPSGVTSQFG
jgi:hypothetical protein